MAFFEREKKKPFLPTFHLFWNVICAKGSSNTSILPCLSSLSLHCHHACSTFSMDGPISLHLYSLAYHYMQMQHDELECNPKRKLSPSYCSFKLHFLVLKRKPHLTQLAKRTSDSHNMYSTFCFGKKHRLTQLAKITFDSCKICSMFIIYVQIIGSCLQLHPQLAAHHSMNN